MQCEGSSLLEMLDGLGVQEKDVTKSNFGADEGNEIQVLCSMSSPEFFALGVDGLGDERPHVTGSLGEMKDRAFGFMQYQGLAS